MSYAATLTEIEAALGGIEGLRVLTDIGATPKPPAVLIGPPLLTYETFQAAPTEAALPLALVVTANAQAVPRLLALLAQVETAIHDGTNGAVVRAEPGSWPAGGGSYLPAYLIEIEVSL